MGGLIEGDGWKNWNELKFEKLVTLLVLIPLNPYGDKITVNETSHENHKRVEVTS